MARVDEEDRPAFEAWVDSDHCIHGGDMKPSLVHFVNQYLGTYESEEAFAKERAEELDLLAGGSPDLWPYNHINWAGAASELLREYRSQRLPDGRVAVFEAAR
jgi:antirestriction protein